MSNNPVYCFDFTLPAEGLTDDVVLTKIKNISKKGVFQLEEGELTKYRHYQGRISTIKKYRLSEIIKLKVFEKIHWSITSNASKSNYDYVSKDYTKIGETINITDKPNYIPRQIREIPSLYPWQTSVISSLKQWDTRIVNMIYDPEGNKGKSILVGWIRAYKLGRALPPVNDFKDFLRMVCDLPTAPAYIVDMPRALKKDKLGGFYSAIETVKDGYAYDDRYTFTEKNFDCPVIWVMSNTLPDFSLLTRQRWKVWEITGDKELIPIDINDLI
jgi:hypothetical protein